MSNFKGLTWDKRNQSWRVSISALGKKYWINNYRDDGLQPGEPREVYAARMYDAVAMRVLGIRSILDLNFPNDHQIALDERAEQVVQDIEEEARRESGRLFLIKKVLNKLDTIVCKAKVDPAQSHLRARWNILSEVLFLLMEKGEGWFDRATLKLTLKDALEVQFEGTA